MAVLKCKMCGGDLILTEGSTVAECEFCGTTQTIPTVDNEKKLTLFARANRLRAACEFDKAYSIYESIVAEFPEEAEAYWGLCLCKFGIEYVEDTDGSRKPTCHRTVPTSIFDDGDFEEVMEHADGASRLVYRNEAREIERVQRRILEIAQSEDPYDVFICYKETDEAGNRTEDSVLAQDVYDALTEKGLKVFFSRITLESKLGSEYEPYIYAALSSAKVMLAFGTDSDYYSAVWVKNEWSRYLSMMKSDRTKSLIPCFKGLDAYDMPREFRNLQAQDLGKLGWQQDLVRGILKLCNKDSKAKAAVATVTNAASPTVDSYLKRVFMFLEDGDWSSADEYCEKVLDQDPENAQAYLGKLMAELKVRTMQDFMGCRGPLENCSIYKKVLRFADSELAGQLENYNDYTKKNVSYVLACEKMKTAKTENDFLYAAELFESTPGFRLSEQKASTCREKAEESRVDAIYAKAEKHFNSGEHDYPPNSSFRVTEYNAAIVEYSKIPGWKDSDMKLARCRKFVKEAKEAQKRQDELDRQAAIEKAEEAERKRKRNIVVAIASGIILAVILLVTQVIIPNSKYNAAIKLMDDEKYEEAIAAFEAMDGYKDSTDKISACHTALKDIDYNASISLLNDGKIIEAYDSLIALNGYKDSTAKASEIFVKYKIEKLKIAEVGDTVYFGAYEQDNNTSNGKEEIEWQVLAKEENKILIISKYALDCQQYNTSHTGVTWESCSLRKWMNGTFLNNAFSTEEQAQIQNTTVSADKNPRYSTNPGNATTDKVFLLSINEVEKYFNSDGARKCVPTAYAKAQGARTYDIIYKTPSGFWWLRSPGDNQLIAARVDYSGSVLCAASLVDRGGSLSFAGGSVDDSHYCVRPALWINLDS